MNLRNPPESELIFAPAAQRALSSLMQRKVAAGTAARISPGVFTTQLTIPLESVVRRNWKTLLEHELPGAVLSYRSAIHGGPDKDNVVVVSYGKRAPSRSYPGLTVEVRPGGPLPGDAPYGKLFVASETRWLLECLEAVKGSASRTVPAEQIELYLDKALQLRGESNLNALRDKAREFAQAHGREREFKRLDRIVGALLATRNARSLTSRQALARAAGKPYDGECLKLFDTLFAALQQAALPDIKEVANSPAAKDNQAFFEAYFSNYIEGTAFTVEEAEDIVYRGAVLVNRLEDTHDILGTYQAATSSPWRDAFPKSGEDFLAWLKSVNGLVMSRRLDKKPGEWKDKTNQAGSTVFVHPDLVRGTLLEGFDRITGLSSPAARAFMAMFIVAEVHPFMDGNGRTARLALNCALTEAGLSRILVPTIFREDYLLPLKALSHQGTPDAYISMLVRLQTWASSLNYAQTREDLRAQLTRCNTFQENRNLYRLINPY
ncbi:Fic family protein [Sulfuriferula plumbiphila]|uniref:Fic family protein n=1 Tax=Sulfuriferula plumbiphila TaxID=171865 RepID=A0A512LCH2_9PROT|nr:Fic family protein [Sulfuriferula plumbiphila]BBP05739.1 Fic family protein [Sulfuriferula plumbiphila]GEP32179.1 Fic family protein [Sulfuriferula plumbiphila]